MIHPEKTKILSSQSSDTKKKLIEVDNIKIEILTRGQSARYATHREHGHPPQSTV